VRDVGERVGSYVSKKHYLHATQLLVTSLNRLSNDLKMVEALKEVNSDLHSRKEVSYAKNTLELSEINLLYIMQRRIYFYL